MAAADLLATQRDTGAPRSPVALLLDKPQVRTAGLGALTRVTGALPGTPPHSGCGRCKPA